MYHPTAGLHSPVVVDPRAPNFDDVVLAVRCLPGDLLTRSEAGVLCQRVATLFENQGATVQLIEQGFALNDLVDTPDRPVDLTVELRGRMLHEATYPLSWVLCVGSFTLLPGVREHSFATEVTIRDASGFLLVTESLEGRLVERFGLGPYFGNKFLDLVARKKEDELTGDGSNRDISDDLYGQLSQLAFNAKMQWQVLQASAQVPAGAELDSLPGITEDEP